MKILSSYTHPNLFEFLSSAEHKGRYFEECQLPNSLLDPLTSIVFLFFLLWKSMGPAPVNSHSPKYLPYSMKRNTRQRTEQTEGLIYAQDSKN